MPFPLLIVFKVQSEDPLQDLGLVNDRLSLWTGSSEDFICSGLLVILGDPEAESPQSGCRSRGFRGHTGQVQLTDQLPFPAPPWMTANQRPPAPPKLVPGQIVATNLPPEDQDGSGDDSDNFSGSGAGALQDITLSQQTPSTWKDTWLLTATPTSPEPTGLEATAASTSTLPAGEGPKEGEAVVLLEVEPDLTAQEQEATPQPTETTQLPTTHQAPTARATTAQEPATSHPHRDMQPGYHETSAPAGPGQADLHTPRTEDGGPSATERAAEDGASSQLPAAEGSGEQDFTFETSGENTAIVAVEPDHRNQSPVDPGATGASQGLLDRKEVLGGIIAGGLVGLIFAVCLVGFMLYRMKKKDEGSYSLEEPKQANGGAYQKPTKQEEFYA